MNSQSGLGRIPSLHGADGVEFVHTFFSPRLSENTSPVGAAYERPLSWSGDTVGGHRPPLQHHIQRNQRKARTNVTMPQAARIATCDHHCGSVWPSRITARSPLISGVSGSALISGCATAGKRSDEKKMPDRIHIGSITRFIRPDTVSRVLARLATSSPTPENVTAPKNTRTTRPSRLPGTGPPNAT